MFTNANQIHARTHARTHAHTRTHARTHTHTHTSNMFSHFSDHLIEKKNIIMSLSVSYGSLCIILDVTPFQHSLHYDRGQEEEATHIQFV